MYTTTEKGEGVVGYSLMNLTPMEMQQMCKMHTQVMDVLISHHPKYKGKKMYLSDDDLLNIAAILSTLTKDCPECISAFDIARARILDEQEEIFEKCEKEPLDI